MAAVLALCQLLHKPVDGRDVALCLFLAHFGLRRLLLHAEVAEILANVPSRV